MAEDRERCDIPPPESWMNAREAAETIGVSVMQVLRLATDGRLEGCFWYNEKNRPVRFVSRQSVSQLIDAGYPKKRPQPRTHAAKKTRAQLARDLEAEKGVLAASAFRMLMQGKGWHDLVIELCVTPQQATDFVLAFQGGPSHVLGEAKRKNALEQQAKVIRLYNRGK
jgi:hypothetical protein